MKRGTASDLGTEEKSVEPDTQITLVDAANIELLIHTVRGQQVMLNTDLARLYEVEAKNLNRAVARNADRFPGDFRFQLTKEEDESLRCQIGTSKITDGRGGRRYLPYAYSCCVRLHIVKTSISSGRKSKKNRESALAVEKLADEFTLISRSHVSRVAISFRCIGNAALIEMP